jgi:hypothetical protein
MAADPARIATLSGRGFTTAQLLQVVAFHDPALVATHFNDTKSVIATKIADIEDANPTAPKAEDILAGTTTPPTTPPPSTPKKKKGGKKKNKKGHHEGGIWHRLTHPRNEW